MYNIFLQWFPIDTTMT